MTTLTSDVLVVGAGLAGFTVAVRATEQGAQVLLIDKSTGELGDGNILMASGSLRAGGKNPRTNPRELYDFVMAEGIGYPDLVKSWSETCGRAVDWLIASGVKVAETESAITLADNQGKKHTVPLADIEERQQQRTSTMPEGLEKRITTEEFIDLLAFLMSQCEVKKP